MRRRPRERRLAGQHLDKVTHPVIEDKSRSISNPYATGWFPTQVILDRTMIIRYKEGEDYDEDRIVALIKQYL